MDPLLPKKDSFNMLASRLTRFSARRVYSLVSARSIGDSSASLHLIFAADRVEYALYGWGSSMRGLGEHLRSKDKRLPKPVLDFDQPIRSLAVGSEHCAVATGSTPFSPLE